MTKYWGFFAQKIMSKLSFQNWFSENDPFLKMAKTPTKKSKPIILFGSKCLLSHFLLILGADKNLRCIVVGGSKNVKTNFT